MFYSLQTLKLYFLSKKYLFSKHKFIKDLFMRFTPYEYSSLLTNIFCNGIFSQLFSVSKKNSRNGKKTSMALLLSLKIGILPNVYRNTCCYFISQTPLGYDQPFNAKQLPASRFDLFNIVTAPHLEVSRKS
jgi:hypothetical protein